MKLPKVVMLLADMLSMAGLNDPHLDERPYKREYKSTLNDKQKAKRRSKNKLRKQGRKNSKR